MGRQPLSAEDEVEVLCFDPWAGDMDSDAVTMRDGFVVTRKASSCAICGDDIPKGERVRAQTQRSAEMGKVLTFRFCGLCCSAMLVSYHYDEIIEARYALGMCRAQELRARDRTEARQSLAT